VSDLGPKPAFFWDETTKTFRKAVVGEPGEYVWNNTTNSWEFGTVGAEYVYNHTTNSWEFGPGGQYVRNQTTNAWDKVLSPGYGGPYYWDEATGSWLKNAASVDVAEAYARWDFLTNQAWFGGDYVGALSSTPGWSFTRASTGYAQTSGGALQAFASGELRRTDKGVLIEGARTNLFTYSQQFDHANWGKTDVTVTADQVAGPDGTLTGDLATDGSAGTAALAQTQTVTVANPIAVSFIAKRGNSDWLFVQIAGSGTERLRGWFNLATGAAGSATVVAPGASASVVMRALADGWYICTLVGTLNGAGTTAAVFTCTMSADAGLTRVNGATRYMWHAQLEAASFASSPIVTTAASQTRAADVLTVPVSALTYPLSLFAEFERAVDTGGTEIIFLVDDGDGTDRCYLRVTASDALGGVVTTSSSDVADQVVTGTVAVGTATKGAARFATDDTKACRGGSLSSGDTSCAMPATPVAVRFGGTNTAGAMPFGYLRRAAIFSRALTDSELQAVTS